jgi:hypothetical protein
MYVAQVIPRVDAEIVEKGHFWMEREIPWKGVPR